MARLTPILFPNRYAYCLPPKTAVRRAGDLIPSEESASLWLWAWPRLLGWPRRINWLFSPVTGKTRYPGDLWGIDTVGDLIVVETKIDRLRATQNPFEDFVSCATSGVQPQWRAAELERRWHGLLSDERYFVATQLGRGISGLNSGLFRGVVPYSSHRRAVWHWWDLYRERIKPRVTSPVYEGAVRRGLRYREAAGNPMPIFVGLVATVRSAEPTLSRRGKEALMALRRQVGSDKVVSRAVRITRGPKMLRIHCWSPPWVVS